ncbi:MAG: hypothetical protein HKO63_05115 [Acidimicrobiia bacterium]|nr:hypothetical protein [Acidimicrobiia bacterium]NNF88464.1 hypothetical protein [Acidimicrobiia bacterium]NNL97566.1 hypothetical protein [Acidimicrobiia bacterium]
MTTDTRSHAVPDTVAAESTAWRRLDDRIPLRLMLAVAVLWAVSLYVVFSLAPAPPAEDPSAAAVLVGLGFELSLLATIAGFVILRRWGLLASAGGGVVLLVGAGLCSLGGHTGGWLVAQYVTGAAIFGVSWAAFRRF